MKKENGLERKEQCNKKLKNKEHCDMWQTKERQLKLESKDKEKFNFKEI